MLNASGVGIATGYDADFNVEMRSAGLANLLVGLAGGIVGYQSMNRTMLNRRVSARFAMNSTAASGTRTCSARSRIRSACMRAGPP
jgi:SulP family sulfate permease